MIKITQDIYNALLAVAPIMGVSYNDETGKAVAHFKPEATVDERAAAQAIIDAYDYAGAHAKQKTFDEAVAAGFDTGLGFKLPMTETARKDFTELRGQLREGLELGAITDSSPCPVQLTDTEGTTHQLTVGQVRQAIFAGGVYYASLLRALRS